MIVFCCSTKVYLACSELLPVYSTLLGKCLKYCVIGIGTCSCVSAATSLGNAVCTCTMLSWHAGLTAVDIAINNKQVNLVRRLEQGAAFAGWLNQKVTK